MNVFEYQAIDQRFNKVFNNGMYCASKFLVPKILASYGGFQGIDKLVDIGGGTGSALHWIISMFPHIKGINFDLPHVVSEASPIPGYFSTST